VRRKTLGSKAAGKDMEVILGRLDYRRMNHIQLRRRKRIPA